MGSTAVDEASTRTLAAEPSAAILRVIHHVQTAYDDRVSPSEPLRFVVKELLAITGSAGGFVAEASPGNGRAELTVRAAIGVRVAPEVARLETRDAQPCVEQRQLAAGNEFELRAEQPPEAVEAAARRGSIKAATQPHFPGSVFLHPGVGRGHDELGSLPGQRRQLRQTSPGVGQPVKQVGEQNHVERAQSRIG